VCHHELVPFSVMLCSLGEYGLFSYAVACFLDE
jgi:hypothetical protein